RIERAYELVLRPLRHHLRVEVAAHGLEVGRFERRPDLVESAPGGLDFPIADALDGMERFGGLLREHTADGVELYTDRRKLFGLEDRPETGGKGGGFHEASSRHFSIMPRKKGAGCPHFTDNPARGDC